MPSRFRSLAILAARAADDKKALAIELRKVEEISPLAEFVLLASVHSRPQMEAVAEEIRLRLKEEGSLPVHRDGTRSDHWRVLDYGGLMVHLMHPRAREFYAMDKLYDEGGKVPWKPRAAAKKGTKK